MWSWISLDLETSLASLTQKLNQSLSRLGTDVSRFNQTDGYVIDITHPRYGAVPDAQQDAGTGVWSGTNNTKAIQAAFDDASSQNGTLPGQSRLPGSPRVFIPPGAFLYDSLRLKKTQLNISGSAPLESLLVTNSGGIVADAMPYGVYDWSNFGLIGGSASGVGIDLSTISSNVYQSRFRNLHIESGQQMLLAPVSVFSSTLDTIIGFSYNNHGIHANVGPSVTLINLWAGTYGSLKACYRLTGSIRMIGCNGTDYGDFWLIAGNQLGGTSGYDGDFSFQSYPDIVLDSCNIESWARNGPTPSVGDAAASLGASAIYTVAGFTCLKMTGGTFVRALATNYHSLVRTNRQALPLDGGYVELDGVRLFISGGVPTAAYFYSDAQNKVLLKNVVEPSLGLTQVNAGTGATYLPIIAGSSSDVFSAFAVRYNGLTARRFTAEVLRYKELQPPSGTTAVDVTGYECVRTQNAAPTTMANFSFTTTIAADVDFGRNGRLKIMIEDANTTLKHLSATANFGMKLKAGVDYVAAKGDVLLFEYSNFYDGTHPGWVQV